MRQWAARNFARSFDPAGFTRQGTAILVDRYESSGYRHSHLADIQAPTLVVQGDADPLVPMAAAKELASTVPGAKLQVVTGLGHDTPVELVPLFVDAITATAARATN